MRRRYSNVSYDPQRDFAMIGMVTTIPMWLLVNGKLPVSTPPEFIAYVKSQPHGAVNIAAAKTRHGAAPDAGALERAGSAEHDTRAIPGRRTGDDRSARLVQRHRSTLAHVKSGALKALAVAMPKRVASFPDMPTFIELSYDVGASRAPSSLSVPPAKGNACRGNKMGAGSLFAAERAT